LARGTGAAQSRVIIWRQAYADAAVSAIVQFNCRL
jgi:hypothetical protein